MRFSIATALLLLSLPSLLVGAVSIGVAIGLVVSAVFNLSLDLVLFMLSLVAFDLLLMVVAATFPLDFDRFSFGYVAAGSLPLEDLLVLP